MNEQELKATSLEERITKSIRDKYPESVWLPIPEERTAKDAVAADLLRKMAPAMAKLACEVFEANLTSIREQIEGEKHDEDSDDDDDFYFDLGLDKSLEIIDKERGVR